MSKIKSSILAVLIAVPLNTQADFNFEWITKVSSNFNFDWITKVSPKQIAIGTALCGCAYLSLHNSLKNTRDDLHQFIFNEKCRKANLLISESTDLLNTISDLYVVFPYKNSFADCNEKDLSILIHCMPILQEIEVTIADLKNIVAEIKRCQDLQENTLTAHDLICKCENYILSLQLELHSLRLITAYHKDYIECTNLLLSIEDQYQEEFKKDNKYSMLQMAIKCAISSYYKPDYIDNDSYNNYLLDYAETLRTNYVKFDKFIYSFKERTYPCLAKRLYEVFKKLDTLKCIIDENTKYLSRSNHNNNKVTPKKTNLCFHSHNSRFNTYNSQNNTSSSSFSNNSNASSINDEGSVCTSCGNAIPAGYAICGTCSQEILNSCK